MCAAGPSRRQQRIDAAELDLLLDLASGRKTFAQVCRDASSFSYQGSELQRLCTSNAARGITQRLTTMTGVDSDSLTYIGIRCGDRVVNHPFALLSDHIEREYAKDNTYFDPHPQVSSFLDTAEYRQHPLVQMCEGTDTVVVPFSIYGDGVQVTEAPLENTLYVVFLTFLHRGARHGSLEHNKHVYTVYCKNDHTRNTLDDVFKVLVWELTALQHGMMPLLGKERKP